MFLKDYHRRVRDYLDSIGATRISYTQSNNHGRFEFQYQGREFRCTAAGTPSDRRAHKNTIADIKRRIKVST